MKKRKLLLLVLILTCILSACGTNFTRYLVDYNKNTSELIEIQTHSAVLHDLSNSLNNDSVDPSADAYFKLCDDAENGFYGLFTECKIGEEGVMIIKVTNTQRLLLMNMLQKQMKLIPEYIINNDDACNNFEFSDDYECLSFYINPDMVDAFMFNWMNNGRFVWTYQLYRSLDAKETTKVMEKIINNESGYVINQCYYGSFLNDDESLSWNDYIINRSFYDDFAETTSVDAVFIGCFTDSSGSIAKDYAKFQVCDGRFFDENEVICVKIHNINNLVDLEEYTTVRIEFDTELYVHDVSLDDTTSIIFIEDEYLRSIDCK